jgi:hypothetical protein
LKTQIFIQQTNGNRWNRIVTLLVILVLFCSACERRQATLIVQQLTPPSLTGRAPKLTIDKNENVVFSWLEKTSDSAGQLRFAVQQNNSWTTPAKVTQGPLSTEEFASAFVLSPSAQQFVAFWTEIKDHNHASWTELGYLSRSTDNGKTWSQPVPLATDFSKTEHSYLSGSVLDSGTVGVTWLDGRDTANNPAGHYHLMAAMLYPDGHYSGEKLLDDNVCTCCPTAAISLSDKMLIAYRDRTQDEIRDISTMQLSENLSMDGPYPIHHDGWQINACPTNGPTLGARNANVTAAWFTGAEGPHLFVASSKDGGKHFSPPEQVSTTDSTVGHPSIAVLPDGSSILAWIESGNPESRLLALQVRNDGHLGPVVEIAHGSHFGYPAMRAQGNSALLAWMQGGKTDSSLHLARLELSKL